MPSFTGISSITGIATLSNSGFDAAATAFIAAAGITDTTQQTAINNLVVAAKANGWWDKCIAIYPFVGGTANSHKYNLKDPRDLDAAYRIVFTGSPTQNSNGVTWNSNSYGNTFIVPSSNLTFDNTHASVYSRTNSSEGTYEYGCLGVVDGAASRIIVHLRFTDNNFYGDMYSATTGRNSVANASSLGYYMDTRTSSTSHTAYKNGSQITTNTTAVTSVVPTCSMFLGAAQDCGTSTASLISSRNMAFFTAGSGLTGTDASNMYTDIQAFQTTLGRQV